MAAWGPSASKVIFIGDGVSDLPIAREGGADVIFAKQGRALARVCAESGVEQRQMPAEPAHAWCYCL